MTKKTLTLDEKLDWLCLFRTENIGPITFFRLIERLGTARKALDALPDMAKRGGRYAPFKAFSRDDAKKEMAAITDIGAQLIARGEPNYPELLAHTEDAPPLLTVLGDPSLLNKKNIAIVGARNASTNGRKIAQNFAQELSKNGYLITSGLARGIDTAAHEGALASGTIAVVAGGIDVIYPRENTELYKAIARTGAIVAESPYGTQPAARHFPRRNRIISGMCLGALVIEAAMKSGSLITARLAADQGRDVFAIPGSPLDPRSEGTNFLIRDGAHMVTKPEDMLEILNSMRNIPLSDVSSEFDRFGAEQGALPFPPVAEKDMESLRKKILGMLGHDPADIDDVIRAAGASPAIVLTALLELELAGLVERQPGNKVNLIGDTQEGFLNAG